MWNVITTRTIQAKLHTLYCSLTGLNTVTRTLQNIQVAVSFTGQAAAIGLSIQHIRWKHTCITSMIEDELYILKLPMTDLVTIVKLTESSYMTYYGTQSSVVFVCGVLNSTWVLWSIYYSVCTCIVCTDLSMASLVFVNCRL